MLIQQILQEKGNDVYTIDPEETVYRAIEVMSMRDIGALVVTRDEGLAGIISERDYRNRVILEGRTSKTTKVKEIMTEDVYYVSPNETVETCMALMTNKKIRHLPVMEEDRLTGIVSIGDLVKTIISQQKVEIHHLRHYISGAYPA